MTTSTSAPKRILVTGATGYVGGRLVPRLLAEGHHVRCMVRDPSRVGERSWEKEAEVVAGDVLQPESLEPALAGADTAYYLVHSMAGGKGFHERDLEGARNFGAAAVAAGCRRIIYLGGLIPDSGDLSNHLESRKATGEALRQAGVQVIEFRAGVVVGSGSLSFEMVRHLTERIPVLIMPRWVHTRTQPIGIRELLSYLTAAASLEQEGHQIIEIGGSDVVSYGDMMMIYAKIRGLRRLSVPVPVLTPRLSSYWVDLVTPIPAAIARPLIDGLKTPLEVTDDKARQFFPEIIPVSYEQSVRRALDNLAASEVETAWTDALASSRKDAPPVVLRSVEGMIIERRRREVKAPADGVFRVFTGIGGGRGWFFMNWAWVIRGFVDRLFGGVGLRRGRRDANQLRPGDSLDFWRVEALEPGRMLRLYAEMKVPGEAWLQFETRTLDGGRTELLQTAFFAPKGLSGLAYWYLIYPAHAFIFSGLIRRIADRAEKDHDNETGA